MPFSAALSTEPRTLQAMDEVCRQTQSRVSGPSDLAVLFFSPHHAERIAEAVEKAWQGLQPLLLNRLHGRIDHWQRQGS